MRLKHLVPGLLVAALLGVGVLSGEARAAAPTLAGYQINLGGQWVPGSVGMWFDSSYTSILPGGMPRPVSAEYPQPVACITGCNGSGAGGTVSQGAQASAQSSNEWYVQDVALRLSAVTIAAATRPNDTANNRTQTHDDQLAAIATSVAPRSGAWTDASYTATSAASIPAALTAVAFRTGIDIENLNTPGGATACMNWTTTAAVSGSGCAVGSIPIYAGGARTWDQPGNVSPEAISLICAGSACPLTIKVR